MLNAFIRNRAEEFEHDVWSNYVLPLYYPQLGLTEARKSCVLQGGRGCGKTALLRYLSYQSQFSPKRINIPDKTLDTVGLYLKADSQYFSSFTGYEIEERRWKDIFEHALCLALAEQIINAVLTLNCSEERLARYGELTNLDFNDAVSGFFGSEIPSSPENFCKWLRQQRQFLSRWFKNIDAEQPPTMLPLKEFLTSVITEIRTKLPYMNGSVFAVYIDEYENLLDYQQRFLNTLIKSGEPPLIFHVAMKPNGMRTRHTIGNESIQETSDYRLIPLDELLRPDFKLFCAELFFFRLITGSNLPEEDTPVIQNHLRSEVNFIERSTVLYRQRVLKEIETILPGRRYGEISQEVLANSTLNRRWKKIIDEGIKQQSSPLKSEDFFDLNHPEASVTCAALLHQKTKKADEVLLEFNKLRNGDQNKFKDGEWIHHFLLGSLLLMYLPLRQIPCPIYAGFDAFVQLSGTSVRHFLELCHLSIGDRFSQSDLVQTSISVDRQAEAASIASRKFRGEVSSCGDHGNRLFALVNFLGKLFRLSQARYSQSEPERTHFSIVGAELTESSEKILNEAIKWSVLFPTEETKVKGNRYESNDYVLNPIYAPFFGISFNKGRKLEIPTNQSETMFTGGLDEFTTLLRQYERQWSLNSADQMGFDWES